MSDVSSAPVTVTRTGDCMTLCLDRPERGNALGAALVAALDTAIDDAVAAGARLIVLRGQGRNFCTGFDLGDLDTVSDGDLALRVLQIELLLQKINGLPVTTMAIAGGRAFGAGADLFAACDHRLVLPDASFVFPGPSFGLVLGTARLGKLIGDGRARRLLLGGEVVDAPLAVAIGLATATISETETEAAIAMAYRAASRLDAVTVAALHARTRGADDDADLAALARSVARPGLKQRIQDYRASVAQRPR